MTSSTQLERETEATRSEIAQTLDELRARITPGQVVDQAVDYARDSGVGEFVHNLGREAVSNPMAIALIGAGLAWLMVSNRRSVSADGSSAGGTRERARGSLSDTARRLGDLGDSARSTADEYVDRGSSVASQFADRAGSTAAQYADRASSGARQISEKARSAAANLGNTASDAATRLGDVAGATRDSVLETTNTVYETAAERARRAASGSVELASTFGQTAAKKSRDLVDVIRDQPLALGAIGLAVGATLGALFPMTETENDLIGETSDQIKGQAQAVVEQQYEKAKDFAAEQYDHAKSAAGEVLRGALDRAADKPGEPASSVGEDAPALVPPDSGAQCGGEVAKTGEKSYGQA